LLAPADRGGARGLHHLDNRRLHLWGGPQPYIRTFRLYHDRGSTSGFPRPARRPAYCVRQRYWPGKRQPQWTQRPRASGATERAQSMASPSASPERSVARSSPRSSGTPLRWGSGPASRAAGTKASGYMTRSACASSPAQTVLHTSSQYLTISRSVRSLTPGLRNGRVVEKEASLAGLPIR
jgi:hypothetical protein